MNEMSNFSYFYIFLYFLFKIAIKSIFYESLVKIVLLLLLLLLLLFLSNCWDIDYSMIDLQFMRDKLWMFGSKKYWFLILDD